MNGTSERHPSHELLKSLALGRCDDDGLAGIEDHVAGCAECAQVLAATPQDAFVSLLQTAQSFSDTAPPTQCATLTTPLPADKDGLTALWPCSGGPASAKLPALPADHPRYRPLRVLGQGGMGAVWLAEHKLMRRNVAVKVIRPEILAKPGATERFRNEVHSAARLHHPNIVTAFDADETADTPLLVMEYVEGVSLADEVRVRGPLPIIEACDAIRQAAVGLQHAHEKGLVHRDLKPQNLMRTPEGVVKILDFGLAVLNDVEQAPLPPSAASAHTATGLTGVNMVVGTPDYIAPEQADDSHKADVKSDIYSLGCTLYHLLTGRVPFPDETILRKLDGHRTQEPTPIRELRPEVPEKLAVVVARMMAKRPDERHESAAAVSEALMPFTQAATPTPPHHRRRPVVLAVLALALGVLGWTYGASVYRFATNQGLLIIETDDPDIEVTVKRGGEKVTIIDAKTGREVTLTAGAYQMEITKGKEGLTLSARDFTLSRGGKQIVHVTFAPTAPPEKVGALPRFKPKDGFWPADALERSRIPIAALTRAGMGDAKKAPAEIVAILGEGTDKRLYSRIAVSPDGTLIAQGDNSGNIRLWDVFTGAVRNLEEGHNDLVIKLAFSPDGLTLATAGHDNLVKVWDVATGKKRHTLPGSVWNNLAFSRDGKCLSGISADRLAVLVWNTADFKLMRTLRPTSGRAINEVAFHPDGKTLALGAEDNTIWIWDLTSDGPPRKLAGHSHWVWSVSFSPDGKTLLSADRGNGMIKLWDSADWRLLGSTRHAPELTIPRFSPDGRLLASRAPDGAIQIWDVVDAELKPKRRIVAGPLADGLAWMPDGRHLALANMDGTIYILRIATATKKEPTP